jgi:hypothetical protein
MTRQKKTTRQKIEDAALLLVFLPIILIVLVPLLLIVFTFYLIHRSVLYLLIWLLWLPRGKDVLVITSDSPIWRDYIANEVLPLVQARAVVLNWSARKRWPKWSFSRHVFRTFAGEREFNPMVVLFPIFRPARLFRFWSAFKSFKTGDTEAVERLRLELRLAL